MPALLNRVCQFAACLILFAGYLTSPVCAQTDPTKKPIAPPPLKIPTKEIVHDVLVNQAGAAQVAYINQLVQKGWDDNKLTPSDRCDDYTFIRRASLDLFGRIAKVNEIERFMRDSKTERRSLLIERMLASEEFAQNFAGIWTIHLLTRSNSSPLHQEQLQDWLAGKLTEKRQGKNIVHAPDWSEIVTDLLTATGKTNVNPAANFILHHLGEPVSKDQAERERLGAYDMVPITSRTTRLFLGERTQCVQCHDHPFNGDWKQSHFWGINAFFRQTDAPLGRPTMTAQKKKKKGDPPQQQFDLEDNTKLNSKGLVFYERRNASMFATDATFLDGRKVSLKDGTPRRKELARLIITSPFFAKAFVNRTWAHFFGKSFTKDNVDDFGDHNPVTNPELLDRLSDDFAKKYSHNPKDLIRWICNSRAYGLSSVANKTNDKPEDEVFFSRMLLKSMSPEQLFESLMIATDAKVAQSKAAKFELREAWLRKLIANFGDDEGNEVSYNGTVVQALILINGKDINDAINDKKDGTVAEILKKQEDLIKRNAITQEGAFKLPMTQIFLATLNRPPTETEFAKILNPKVFMFRPDFQKTIPLKTAQENLAFRTAFYQDLMWAVLNSNEFILNH